MDIALNPMGMAISSHSVARRFISDGAIEDLTRNMSKEVTNFNQWHKLAQ